MDRIYPRLQYLIVTGLLVAVGAYFIFQGVLPAIWAWIPAITTSLALIFGLEMVWQASQRRHLETTAHQEAQSALAELRQQAQLVFSTQQQFLTAISERDVLEGALRVGSQLAGAQGASFLPFDEYGQSLPALATGIIPETTMSNWTNRLLSPGTRQTCKACQALEGKNGCILLPEDIKKPSVVRCFHLSAAHRQVGSFNFFFETPQVITGDRQMLLQEVMTSAGKALDNLRTRDQETAALRYLQTSNAPRSNLTHQLNDLLESVQTALDTDFALLYIPGGIGSGPATSPLLLSRPRPDASVEIPDPAFLEGIWKSALTSSHSISLENVTLNNRAVWKVLLAVPLVWQTANPAGVLVLGSKSSQAFAERQRVLLETLASQAALLIQNARLMVQVEYQAVVDERTRLAREIHDGLAQTLAFLKIQAAQMQNYLTRGDTERLTSTLQASYRTLSDAYLDARQAIDNLRRIPSASLRDWVQQVAEDFEQSSEIAVKVHGFNLQLEFSANIQAQLIRVVQEALSNVRKHAHASQVVISARERKGFVLLEVRDNGVGFSPDAVVAASRYGLRGMRERADSIGAEFQIASRSGEGTTILLSIPAPIKEEL